ncbi:MAG: bifunctional sulfate adenylyltransferase subunit 1/adenylylsulfate kinase protein [Pseudonocardiales bacterium]|nr:bifunctional sulfate adenylyltransferase subunit 1/adenylylsulfate kinase protein [Pseudonocardiales bacterium]
MDAGLVAPHGGRLVNLVVDPGRATELRRLSAAWPSWPLTRRQLCDLELLACGGFSPLRGFLDQRDYLSVCESMRLADGTLWPVPVTLDVPDDVLSQAKAGVLALRDPEGVLSAVLRIEEVWQPDLRAEAELVFGTTDAAHPGVLHLMRETERNYVSGRLHVLESPAHADFRNLRLTPGQVRVEFSRRGWERIVAFQTRNPMHRAHQELTLRAARVAGASVLIHPVVGVGKPGDLDSYTRVRCYQAILPTYPDDTAMLSLLPLAMRMAGPREAVWHAIIRKNYGATHFIVGRDHAGPGKDSSGQQFYRPYDAHALLRRYVGEIGVEVLAFKRLAYLPDHDRYVPADRAPAGKRAWSISGTELRERIACGALLPSWFTHPDVAAQLRRSYPPRSEQGFTVFFTGLSGAGKSTIANILEATLRERRDRPVTVLDGDLVRQYLSSGAGFTRTERDANVRRIGFVAAEVTKHGGIAICAAIAPYDQPRREVRQLVEPVGGFVLVHVATTLDECERRDRKGLYAKARGGLLPHFTGVSDPYEEPADADLRLDTNDMSADQAAQRIIEHLQTLGYLDAPSDATQSMDGGRHIESASLRAATGTAL